MRCQIWERNGSYALLVGDRCDDDLIANFSIKVHEFNAQSRDDAEDIKEDFMKRHKEKMARRKKL